MTVAAFFDFGWWDEAELLVVEQDRSADRQAERDFVEGEIPFYFDGMVDQIKLPFFQDCLRAKLGQREKAQVLSLPAFFVLNLRDKRLGEV